MKILTLLVIVLPVMGCAKQDSLMVVDTVSGANFQWFFKRKIIPAAREKLEFDIDYILSSGPEMVERMKSWGEGMPEVDVILLKPRDLAAVMDAGLPLLRMDAAKVSRASHIHAIESESILGRELLYRALPVWRSQTGLIYNSRFVVEPPESWKEFRDRADTWHDRIGVIRPDAKSSGGRRFVYGFLAAMGVDMSMPLDTLETSPVWNNAWQALGDFSRHVRMPMGEAPFLFQQFKKEQVWLSVYSMDYTLWARDQGFLPGDIEVAFLEEGTPSGADAYIAIPEGLQTRKEKDAILFVNFLLSEEIQLRLLREMNQYPSVNLPAGISEVMNVPLWREVRKHRIELTGREVIEYIREKATAFMIGSKGEQ